MHRTDSTVVGAGLMFVLLVFVGLAALFITGVAVSGISHGSEEALAVVLSVVLWFCAAAFAKGLFHAAFGERIARWRWSRINARLFEIGFREATADEINQTSRLPVQLMAPYTLATKRGGGIDHLTIGQVSGQEVRCCNVRVRGAAWMDVAAVILKAEASFASTVIRPLMKVGIPPRPDMKRVRFEFERFNRSVAVFSTDPFFASAMVDARMMDWFLADLGRTQIELADRWMVAWCFPRRWHRADPGELLDLLLRFDDKIPRAIPSLFPERHTHQMWRDRSPK